MKIPLIVIGAVIGGVVALFTGEETKPVVETKIETPIAPVVEPEKVAA